MKRVLLFLVLSVAICACGGRNRNQTDTLTETISLLDQGKVIEMDDLMAVADQEVGNTITIVGYVIHTCKHAGRRCFIVGESEEISLRVEAKGEIGGFNRELTGSKLAIMGILKESRLSQEYIAQVEQEVKQRKESSDDADDCETELSNIESMRKWMKENNKDHYVFYYMDGLDFEVLD